MKKIYYIVSLYLFKCKALTCLYPVGYDNINKNLYFLFQHSINSIKLIEYNIESKLLTNNVLSFYNPTSICLLPNSTGLSFIDNGKIKIKYFNKRSATSIKFDNKIKNINMIFWQSEHKFYFSAIHNKKFKIFIYDVKTKQEIIIRAKDPFDCLCPQIISDGLFYIQREGLGNCNNYKIIRSSVANDKYQEIILQENDDVIFLKMLNLNEGFYLKHKAVNNYINFQYCAIHKASDSWKMTKLFEFRLPMRYFFGHNEDRFYESILPFIPKIYGDKILYTSSVENDRLSIFAYSLANGSNQLVYINSFCPFLVENKLYVGKMVNDLTNDIEINNTFSLDRNIFT